MILVSDGAFPYVHTNLYFRVGPAFDPPGKAGLTSLTNRMLLRGTTRRGRAELEEAIEALGTELYTSTQNHAVGLGGAVLTRNLDAYFDLLGEMLSSPAFDPDEVAKVQREMTAELEAAGDEDGTLARLGFRRRAFVDHPLGNPTSPSSIANIDADDIRDHFRRHYTHENLVVAASGDVERERFTTLVDQATSSLPKGPRNDWDSLPPVAPLRSLRVAIIDKPDRSQTQILLGHPARCAADPDFLALSIGVTAFGGTFTARLMQEVRVKRGLSYGAYAHLSAGRVAGEFAISAAPSAEDLPATLDLLLSEFTRFVDEGLTDDEVDFARGYALNAFPFSIETPALRAAQRVRNVLLGRSADFLETYLEQLAALTPDTVRDTVRRHLSPRDLVAVVVCTAEPVKDALAEFGAVSVTPYDEEHL